MTEYSVNPNGEQVPLPVAEDHVGNARVYLADAGPTRPAMHRFSPGDAIGQRAER